MSPEEFEAGRRYINMTASELASIILADPSAPERERELARKVWMGQPNGGSREAGVPLRAR